MRAKCHQIFLPIYDCHTAIRIDPSNVSRPDPLGAFAVREECVVVAVIPDVVVVARGDHRTADYDLAC